MTPHGKMVLFGGCQARVAKFCDAHVFDCATLLWTELRPGKPPLPRSSHSACYDAVGGCMLVFGGYDGRTRFGVVCRLPLLLHWAPV